MKESLFDILNSHPNWEENYMEPATSIEVRTTLYKEMRQAAAQYVDSLLPLGDRWQKAVENDVNEVCRNEPAHTHFNSKRQKLYKIIVSDFLLAVSNSLSSHGFGIGELDRTTQWRLGRQDKGTFIEESLSRDKADRLYTKMKKQGLRVHCFRELCSNLYTVLAYKDETSQTRPQGTNTNGKRGRPVKEFEEFFIDPNDADKIIPILKTLLKGKIGRDAARVIVACYHGRWITEPTVPSIERKFGIGASGLKEPLRCHFHHGEIQEPKFPKFTDEELTPIVEKIRQELEKQPK